MATEVDKGQKMTRIQQALANPQAALKQIGAIMVAESQAAFRDQSFGGKPWKPRGRVNVFGIIADFYAGKKAPPQRRFETRPALRDTGRLAASISWQVVSTHAIKVGSNLQYAGVHHSGGKVKSEPITTQVRKLLWDWLRTKGSEHKRQLGWLLNKKYRDQRLEQNVPARPFVGVTKQTMRDVQEAVGVKILEVRK